MSPRVRVATTGVPPRSRRKAAHGTRVMARWALWAKEEGENREFLRDREEEEGEDKLELKLELGLGSGEEEEGEEALLKEEKEGALIDDEM